MPEIIRNRKDEQGTRIRIQIRKSNLVPIALLKVEERIQSSLTSNRADSREQETRIHLSAYNVPHSGSSSAASDDGRAPGDACQFLRRLPGFPIASYVITWNSYLFQHACNNF